jgi:hypothetical protein
MKCGKTSARLQDQKLKTLSPGASDFRSSSNLASCEREGTDEWATENSNFR